MQPQPYNMLTHALHHIRFISYIDYSQNALKYASIGLSSKTAGFRVQKPKKKNFRLSRKNPRSPSLESCIFETYIKHQFELQKTQKWQYSNHQKNCDLISWQYNLIPTVKCIIHINCAQYSQRMLHIHTCTKLSPMPSLRIRPKGSYQFVHRPEKFYVEYQ